MPRFFNTTLLIIVAMVCWSAMATASVDDAKLSSFSGAAVAIVLVYVFLFTDGDG
jgi:hypothetical protein